jgi:hypothetical protein
MDENQFLDSLGNPQDRDPDDLDAAETLYIPIPHQWHPDLAAFVGATTLPKLIRSDPPNTIDGNIAAQGYFCVKEIKRVAVQLGILIFIKAIQEGGKLLPVIQPVDGRLPSRI